VIPLAVVNATPTAATKAWELMKRVYAKDAHRTAQSVQKVVQANAIRENAKTVSN
jgi:hypothetical protein